MAKSVTKKKWTLMVYLAGDNNLDAAGMADMMEMKQVGSTADINVVVQFDRAGKNSSTNRYYLRKGTTAAKDIVQSLGETNTGDPKVLSDFVAWGVKNYPAEHYLLVLWNHGAGWDDSNLYAGDYLSGATPPIARKRTIIAKGTQKSKTAKPLDFGVARAGMHRARRALFRTTVANMITTRAIAFDDEAKDFLDNIEMKQVLTDVKKRIGHKIDILGFDACLMSMVEVSYQVKGAVDFAVGSEEEEPNEGWPYDGILKALAAKPGMSPAELSRTIASKYLASYKSTANVTFAATDLSAIDSLTSAIDMLAKSLRQSINDASVRSAIMTARSQAQEYSSPYDDYVDLVDVCSLIAHYAAKPDISAACGAVKAAVAKAVIQQGAKGSKVDNSNGTSIYFPKKQVCKLYATLDFAKKTAWPKFLADYLAGAAKRPTLR